MSSRFYQELLATSRRTGLAALASTLLACGGSTGAGSVRDELRSEDAGASGSPDSGSLAGQTEEDSAVPLNPVLVQPPERQGSCPMRGTSAVFTIALEGIASIPQGSRLALVTERDSLSCELSDSPLAIVYDQGDCALSGIDRSWVSLFGSMLRFVTSIPKMPSRVTLTLTSPDGEVLAAEELKPEYVDEEDVITQMFPDCPKNKAAEATVVVGP